MRSFAIAQFYVFAVGFDGDGVDVACRGCRSSLVVEDLGLLIHSIEGRHIDLCRREYAELCALRIMQVRTTPTVFLTQGDERTIGEPLPFVKEAIIHKIAVAFLLIERVRDGRFGIAGEDLQFSLVPIDAQDEQFASGRPSQTREIEILTVGHLHGDDAFGSNIIDADGRLCIRTAGFGVTQALLGRVLGITVDIPTETRNLVFIETDECQHFGIRTPGKQSCRAELLFVQPVSDAGDDIRVLVLRYRHFGTEIEFMDIEVVIFGERHVPSIRAHDRIAYLVKAHARTEFLAGMTHGVHDVPLRQTRTAKNALFVLALQTVPTGCCGLIAHS